MLKGLTVLSLLALAMGLPARASTLDQLVRGYCINAVNSEVRASGTPPPAGMAEYTCDCVVREIGRGQTVNQATSTCRSLAIRKFDL
ncbi:MAG: hypothetical protein AAFX65_04950 [Cyanobacteria bacterium J06638_7]